MNVVVVAPHPDDEVIGVGGTIAKHVRNGDDVYVIVATRGDSVFYSHDYVEIGRQQQKEADDVLGVKEIVYLDLPSPTLDTRLHAELVREIQNGIKAFSPREIYIPHYGDMHMEHRMVEEACMVALRPKEFEELTIYGYEVPSETGWNVPCPHNEFIPNVYVELDVAEIEAKRTALLKLDSQMNKYPSARSVEAIENLAKYRGNTVGASFAEAFMLIRQQRR